MKSILILFTCYDSNSAYTESWARALHDDLVKQQNSAASSLTLSISVDPVRLWPMPSNDRTSSFSMGTVSATNGLRCQIYQADRRV